MSPELLSPAGGFDAALAAFQYGADAVYLGLPRFSARADADNLTPGRLRLLLAHARSFTPAKKVYVTFNTLVQDAELPQAIETLDALDDLAPDGVIVQDLGVARLIRDRFPGLALHASTQLAAHSLESVLALKDLGFTRVVLARELTLDETAHIVRDSGVEIEIFVHGALCYSMSGLCLFSSQTAGRSGNRGRCAYCCREAFTSPERPSAPAAYPFSMRDLALAPILDRVAATGVHSLKIEGRMKSPLYVACVTDYYRRKLDGALTPAAEKALVQDLQTVFSRPWTTLYAEDAAAAPATVIDPVAIGHRGARIGETLAVLRDRDGTRWVRFNTSRALEKHDGLQFELPGGGKPFGCAVNLLREAGARHTLIALPAGATAEVALPPDAPAPEIPRGTPVFCSASQAVRRRYEIRSVRDAALAAGRPADIHIALAPDGLTVRASATDRAPGDITAEFRLPLTLQTARQPAQTPAAVRNAFERLGDTGWRLGTLTLEDPYACYAPPSKLNEARRAALEALSRVWAERRARHREAALADWDLTAPPPPPRPAYTPRWSLKLRAETPPLPADILSGIDTLTLGIGHLPAEALLPMLDAWTARFPRDRILLALPLLTRRHEHAPLAAAVARLAAARWNRWECADLSGHRLLREHSLDAVSADWSLYALNRVAAAEILRLGFRSLVLSPENSAENLRALAARLPHAEALAYQHTPLFISETAPCTGTLHRDPFPLADRRKRAFTVQHLDNRWITVSDTPLCLADRLAETGLSAFRIDLSWSPDPDRFADTVAAVRAGRLPPGTHPARFDRSLA